MKNNKKRGVLAAAGALVTALALALGGSVAAQAAPTVLPANDKGNLIITKLTTPDGALVASDGTDQSGSLPAGAAPIAGVTFEVRKVDNIDLSTNRGWQTAGQLSFDSATGVVSGDDDTGNTVTLGAAAYGTTDASGVPQNSDSTGAISSGNAFRNLDLGVYIVRETITPAGVTPAVPFMVTLPLTNPAGSDWMYDVHVYPKNSKVEVSKTVEDEDVKAQAGTSAARLTWTIDTLVPRIPHETTPGTWVEPTSYVINDQIDSSLAVQSVSVKVVDQSGDDIGGANALVSTDYGVTPAALPAGYGDDVAVTFTAEGRTKLAALAAGAGNRVIVTIETRVQAGATGNIPNNADVVVNGGTPLVVTNPPETHWRNVTFTKQNQDNEPLQGARFTVYDTQANAQSAGTTGKLLGADVDSTATGAVNLGSLIRSDFINGAVTPTLAEFRVYWLVETVAPADYELLAKPIPFVVLDGAANNVTVNASGEVTAVGAALNSVVNVEKNAGFELPLTGGMGTLFLTVGGVAILAVVLLVARRRRNDEAIAE